MALGAQGLQPKMLAGHLLVFVYNGIVGDLPAVLAPQLRKTLYIFERYISPAQT